MDSQQVADIGVLALALSFIIYAVLTPTNLLLAAIAGATVCAAYALGSGRQGIVRPDGWSTVVADVLFGLLASVILLYTVFTPTNILLGVIVVGLLAILWLSGRQENSRGRQRASRDSSVRSGDEERKSSLGAQRDKWNAIPDESGVQRKGKGDEGEHSVNDDNQTAEESRERTAVEHER